MKVFNSQEDMKRPKRNYNKSKKKSWRKNIDISDIDAFQEDQRRDERLGGPIENKASEDFFSLDVELNTSKKPVSRKSERLVREALNSSGLKPSYMKPAKKTLKCHQFINGLPGAKAISQKQGVVKQGHCRIVRAALRLSKNTPIAAKKRSQVSAQKRAAKRDRITRNKTKIQVNFEEDLWEDDSKKDLEMFGEVGKTFMEEPMEYYKVYTHKNKVRVPVVRLQKTSNIPAVVVPKPGASYNPSFQDHQRLIAEAERQEEKKLAIIQKENRMVKKYLPSHKDGITHEKWLQEMSEGLHFEGEEEYLMEDEDEDQDSDSQAVSGKKLPEKRSKQSRRKARTLQVKEQQRLKHKEANILESQVFRLKSYQKEIKKEEEEMALRRAREKQLKKQNTFKTKKLSQHKFEEEDILVPLPHELSSSLRTIDPLGNPLLERYKNLQRRNILDTRVKIKRKQAKTKNIKKKHIKEGMKGFVSSLLN